MKPFISDKQTIHENHAELSLKELSRNQVLSFCSEIEQMLIAQTIECHSVGTLPEDVGQRSLSFLRVLCGIPRNWVSGEFF